MNGKDLKQIKVIIMMEQILNESNELFKDKSFLEALKNGKIEKPEHIEKLKRIKELMEKIK